MILRAVLLSLAAAACSPDGLRNQMRDLALAAGGQAGAAAMLVETGTLVSWNGTDHFPMQSVYKLPIVMSVLARVDAQALKLDQSVKIEKKDLPPAAIYSPIRDAHPGGGLSLPVAELCRAAIVDSDGAASDLLLGLVGTETVMTILRGVGITGITVATTESEMAGGPDVQYRNWATPDAAASLLRILQQGRGLSASSRKMLLDWMASSTPGAHRIKGQLPEGTPVAHKTGSSGMSGGLARATNDIGLVTLPDGRHLAIAVFLSDSPASETIREAAIAGIARAAWDCWAGEAGDAAPKPHRP